MSRVRSILNVSDEEKRKSIMLLKMETMNEKQIGAAKISPLTLFRGACNGDINAIRKALDANIRIDSQNTDGSTALHYAVYNNQFEAVLFLLRNGADLTIRDAEDYDIIKRFNEDEIPKPSNPEAKMAQKKIWAALCLRLYIEDLNEKMLKGVTTIGFGLFKANTEDLLKTANHLWKVVIGSEEEKFLHPYVNNISKKNIFLYNLCDAFINIKELKKAAKEKPVAAAQEAEAKEAAAKLSEKKTNRKARIVDPSELKKEMEILSTNTNGMKL